MNYRTFEPHTYLASLIKCYWVLENTETNFPKKQRIVPDGCTEMIFHYGDYFRQYLGDTDYILQPKSFVFGQITRPLDIEPTGRTGIFAVRFHPDGFMPFATMPASDMQNRAIPLQALFGEDGVTLEHVVIGALSHEERIKLVESFLLKRLVTQGAIDHIIKSSIDLMINLKGQTTVAALSKEINISRRQLERRFSTIIGMSPKQLSKIFRLQSVLKMMSEQEFGTFTDLAYQGDYFDQAHFIKDFKEFMGVSPAKFYAGNMKISVLFLGDHLSHFYNQGDFKEDNFA